MYNNPYLTGAPPLPQPPYQQPGHPSPLTAGTAQQSPQYPQVHPQYPGPQIHSQYPQPGRPQPQSQMPQYPAFGQPSQPLQYSQPGTMVPPTPFGTPQPPPQYSQHTNSQQLAQSPPSTNQAYVLTPITLPVAPGESIPPQYPTWQELVPTSYRHKGLLVYAPAEPADEKQVSSSGPVMAASPQQAAAPAPAVKKPHEPKVIFHMLCHGERESRDTEIQDPVLSSIGAEQCSNLKQSFPYMKDVQLILCSPMRRALETTKIAFSSHLTENRLVAIAWPELRDCSPNGACYFQGFLKRNKGQKEKNFRDSCKGALTGWIGVPSLPVDLSLLYYQWEKDDLNDGHERAESVRLSLHQLVQVLLKGGSWENMKFRPWTDFSDIHVVIFSHNNFLNFLTHRAQFHDIMNDPDVMFQPVQFRSYSFAPASAVGKSEFIDIEKYKLYETPESKGRKHVKDAKPVISAASK